METKATVLSLAGEYAIIETDRKSACDGCHKQSEGSSCAMCAMMGEKSRLQSRAYNPIDARPGDTVLVETPSARVLGYGALVFLLPLAACMAGYGLGSLLPFGTVGQAAAAFCGFIGAFCGVGVYARRVLPRRCDVTITQILSHEEERNTPGV